MPRPHSLLCLADAAAVIGDAGFGPQPFGIGLEREWFVVDGRGRPVTDVAALESAITADGPLPGASRLTFEPGGQVELSSPPAPDVTRALEAADRDGAELRSRLARHGWACVAGGVDATGPRPLVLDQPRYRGMARYFARQGCAGATMMRNTASLQVNVPFGSDVAGQWHHVHDVAPVLGAMFACSPLLDGRPSGWQSTRLATWAALDPHRTRSVARAGAAPCDAWVDYALDAPVMLVHDPDGGPDCSVPDTRLSLRDWIADGHRGCWPDAEDVGYHLTTLFPPVRPRGWLEVRVLDAVPEPWWRVAAAVTVAVCTDPPVRRRLAGEVAAPRDRWITAAWHGLHDPGLAIAGRSVLDAARASLVAQGADADLLDAIDEFGDRYVRRGRTLADDLLDAWARTGALGPDPERVPAVTG